MQPLSVLWAIATKDLTLLRRDRGNFFFTFIFPIIFAAFFGMIFGNRGGEKAKMPIVVLDESRAAQPAVSPRTRATIDGLLADIAADTSWTATTVNTRAELETAVRKDKARAGIIIPKNFNADIASVFGGGGMPLEAVVDRNAIAEAGLLTGKLNELGFKTLARSFQDPVALTDSMNQARLAINQDKDLSIVQKGLYGTLFGSVDALTKAGLGPAGKPLASSDSTTPATPATEASAPAFMPVKVTITEVTELVNTGSPRSSYEITLPQGIVWGLMGCVTAFVIAIATEKSHSTLVRLTTAPLSFSQILMGKALGCFIASLIVEVSVILVFMLAFQVRPDNYPMLLAAIALSAAAFTGVMMFLAGFTRSEGSGTGMARGVILMLAMVGGGTVPLMFLPATVQKLAMISPFTWTVKAFEGALFRAYSWTDFALPATVLIAFGVAGALFGSLALSKADRA